MSMTTIMKFVGVVIISAGAMQVLGLWPAVVIGGAAAAWWMNQD